MPDTDSVLITAHGISDRERQRLESAGKRLIDTTCPLVNRVFITQRGICNRKAITCSLIGRRGHVEVNGITEDLDSCDVIESVEEVIAYTSARLGIICQTTATDRARRGDSWRYRCAESRRRRSNSSTRFARRPRTAKMPSTGCSSESTPLWSLAGETRTTRESWLPDATREASP